MADRRYCSKDGAIHAAAGPGLYDECLHLDGCPPGSAKITSAHELPSKHVIHAVGPIYAKAKREGGETRPQELLEGCYRTSLDLAAGLEVSSGEDETSIAFSCLSTGVYGYPSNDAARVASRCVRDWLEEQEQHKRGAGKVGKVVFCCFLEKDVTAYEEWLPYVPNLLIRIQFPIGEKANIPAPCRKVFPPSDAELPSKQTDGATTSEENVDTTTSNNTHPPAFEPATKKQKQNPPTADDDKEDWEPIEKPHRSLASSTIESATTASSEVDPSGENGLLSESAVHVDADTAAVAAREELEGQKVGHAATGAEAGAGGGLEDEGVEVEKPAGLEEDDGVKVEKPKLAAGMGQTENMLGKDW